MAAQDRSEVPASGDRPEAVQSEGHGEPSPGHHSRHYRRAKRDRGAETRARLVEAAVDVIGRLGFEGASTRLIAKEADANLAAIVYHFGSKEELHLAAAEHIAMNIAGRIGPALASVSAPEYYTSPEAARRGLVILIETYIEVMLGRRDAERWSRFIVREQMQPTAAFEVLFRSMSGALTVSSTLVAVASGRAESEEVRLRTITLLGQVLVFRVAQALILRRMDWTEIGDRERAAIKRVVVANAEALIDSWRDDD